MSRSLFSPAVSMNSSYASLVVFLYMEEILVTANQSSIFQVNVLEFPFLQPEHRPTQIMDVSLEDIIEVRVVLRWRSFAERFTDVAKAFSIDELAFSDVRLLRTRAPRVQAGLACIICAEEAQGHNQCSHNQVKVV